VFNILAFFVTLQEEDVQRPSTKIKKKTCCANKVGSSNVLTQPCLILYKCNADSRGNFLMLTIYLEILPLSLEHDGTM
jgi:hypothetical protein